MCIRDSGIVAEDAKWLLRTGQLTSNMMYTGYIRENDANMIAAAPVSYTHLDVYKRQVLHNSLRLDGCVFL